MGEPATTTKEVAAGQKKVQSRKLLALGHLLGLSHVSL